MDYSSFIITFNEMPSVDDVININESLTSTDLSFIFKANRVNPFEVKIPNAVNIAPEGDPPFYIYSGYVSLNYKTAFDIDYSGYTVTYTTGATGTGLGTVTVTANFINAEFTEVEVPSVCTVEINNADPIPIPIEITNVAFSTYDELPCDNVTVTVTTNVLAVNVTSPVDIDPNIENPFTFTWVRGEEINIYVIDENDNDYDVTVTTPPVLDVNLFTVTTVNTIEGYVTTVSNTLPTGLNLEYTINGVDWQTSNIFIDVPLGLNTIIVRDNYGCFISLDFEIERIILPIYVRSTYSLRMTPAVAFDSAELDVYTYTGDVNNEPSVPDYPLTKPVVELGQTSISFDINYLASEKTNPDIAGYTLSGLQNTNTTDTCWMKTNGTCFDGDEEVYSVSSIILCMYGYGRFSQGYNPTIDKPVLLTNLNQRHFKGYDNRIYFITDKLISIDVTNSDDTFNIPITADLDFNNQYVQSINIKDYENYGNITVTFNYEDDITYTYLFEVLEECKYPVINCVFINRYGFPQSFFFNKVSNYTDDVTDEDYRGLTAQFGVYDTTQHQYVNYNLNGRTKIDVNTDYLTDVENENVKQLLYSEKKWFIQDDVVYPVNLETKSVKYKASLNEKLIQYGMSFKYSFDDINNVQ
jgi:hypothetical protein